MSVRFTPLKATLAALALQSAFAGAAMAQQGGLYFDEQTAAGKGGNTEGQAWGWFHTGTLSAPVTFSAGDPVVIRLYDMDVGETSLGGGDDELQLWRSDASFTAQAGESVRFEFFSVVPSGPLNTAKDHWNDGPLELRARVIQAPAGAAGWGNAPWTWSSRNNGDRDASFGGYPAADHVVHMYYVHPGRGFDGLRPSGAQIPVVALAGNKQIWASASIAYTMVSSTTSETDWNSGTTGKGMSGTIVVANGSDRDALTVNLDWLRLMEDDSPHVGGNQDDLLGEAQSSAPGNYKLAPGATFRWSVDIDVDYDAIDEARDFLNGDGDLEPYANFSVAGDPEVPLSIVSEAEVEATLADQPPTTVAFGATNVTTALPPPPIVTFSGAASSYTVDEYVDIACDVTDTGGGIAYDTCIDVYAPAWSYPAGTTTYTASAFDLFGQEGSDSVSFEVGVTYDSLIAITERFIDHNGVENSLVQKIEAASRARTPEAQDGQVQAYINEVEAQSGNHIIEGYADVLIYWGEQLKLQ